MVEFPMIVTKPLLVVYERDEKVITEMWPSHTCDGYESYGLLICDVVRHAACAFGVPEAAVWYWVDKERADPTSDIETPRSS
jgi:hypothetical protein